MCYDTYSNVSINWVIFLTLYSLYRRQIATYIFNIKTGYKMNTIWYSVVILCNCVWAPRKKSLKLALEHDVVLEEKENIYMQNKIYLRCTNPILRIQGFAITISYFSLCLYICIYHFNPNWIFLHEVVRCPNLRFSLYL